MAAAEFAAKHEGWGPLARYYSSRIHAVDEAISAYSGDLLDIGCGPGMLVRHLLDTRPLDFRITAADRSAAMAGAVAGRTADSPMGVNLAAARIEAMPFADGSFDVVLALGVLEYVDCAAALREMTRVVRPGGAVIVTMLNPASPYRLFEWFVYWPALRVLGHLEGSLRIAPHRRHGAQYSGIRAVRSTRMCRMMLEAGLCPQDVLAYDVTFVVPPFDRVIRRFSRQWRADPERTVSRGTRRWLGTGYLVHTRRRSTSPDGTEVGRPAHDTEVALRQ